MGEVGGDMAKTKRRSRTPPAKKRAKKSTPAKKMLIALLVILLLIVTAMGLIHHWDDIKPPAQDNTPGIEQDDDGIGGVTIDPDHIIV